MVHNKKEQYISEIKKARFSMISSILWLGLWLLLTFLFFFKTAPITCFIIAFSTIAFNIVCLIFNIITYKKNKIEYKNFCDFEEQQSKKCPYYVDGDGSFSLEDY